jgi:ribosomal protein S18 acetylase RimI-like enzyme
MVERLRDKAEIRRRLNADREWSLYALADLDDGLFQYCDWWGFRDAVALVFRALAIRPIFVIGDSEPARELLAGLPESGGYLNIRPDHAGIAEAFYAYRERREVRRMILDDFRPRCGETVKLGVEDCGEIERLYASGDGGGMAFAPFQLETGMFRGVRRDGELVAVAGVQVASRHEGVAAIGNIFTRADCRGQGLAQIVTSAVVDAVKATGIPTIGLNVGYRNAAAIRAYENIGFRIRFAYYEGVVDRVVAG